MTPERRLLLGALLGVVLFALTAGLILAGATQRFDLAVLEGLRVAGQPGRAAFPGWLVELCRLVSPLGTWGVRFGIALGCGIALVARARRRDAAVLISSVVLRTSAGERSNAQAEARMIVRSCAIDEIAATS